MSPIVGTPQRPLRVAVIGSGPAGFYAADALFRVPDLTVQVDVFDRLPTPYGLVRAGVAPDHQKIKKVSRVFDRTAAHAGFRFIGNVTLGRDIQVSELHGHYDQLVYAVGAEAGRELRVPGRGALRYHPAAVIVGWYNGHPDYQRAHFDLSVPSVAIVGNGNVALDIARIFAKNRTELEATDIAPYALRELVNKEITDIYVIGRGDPLRASFTPTELREFRALESAVAMVNEADVAPTSALEAARIDASNRQQQVLSVLREFASAPPRMAQIRVHFLFNSGTREILVDDDGGVRGLRLERTRTSHHEGGSKIHYSGDLFDLKVGMVIPAVGFQTVPIQGVSFDEAGGRVANDEGRVTKDGGVVANEYVVGWARTGPRGVIGAHKVASREVVQKMIEDLPSISPLELPHPDSILDLLRDRGVEPVSFRDWKLLDSIEVRRGEARGAPRAKLSHIGVMLSAIKNADTED